MKKKSTINDNNIDIIQTLINKVIIEHDINESDSFLFKKCIIKDIPKLYLLYYKDNEVFFFANIQNNISTGSDGKFSQTNRHDIIMDDNITNSTGKRSYITIQHQINTNRTYMLNDGIISGLLRNVNHAVTNSSSDNNIKLEHSNEIERYTISKTYNNRYSLCKMIFYVANKNNVFSKVYDVPKHIQAELSNIKHFVKQTFISD